MRFLEDLLPKQAAPCEGRGEGNRLRCIGKSK